MQCCWGKIALDPKRKTTCRGNQYLRRWLRMILLGLTTCAFLCHPSGCLAQNDDEAEYRVKLAFLYNFAQFIEWPPEAFRNPAAPLTICVAGQNPFEGEMAKALVGRQVDGHPIEVRRLKRSDDPQSCQMIFLRDSERKSAGSILAALKGSNTLTVGESRGFAESGGVINLTLVENKLRFEVNLNAAAQTHLRISSKLLALAKIVRSERAP